MRTAIITLSCVVLCLGQLACFEASIGQCHDGIDNNANGLIDCDDPGCESSCSSGDDDGGECDPGDSYPCTCPDNTQSVMTCGPDGEWTACDCQGGDDDAGDDDTSGDDDDSTPEYTGEIDLDNAILAASCVATVESVPDGPTPEGYFDFTIETEGWAESMGVELWDGTSEYCEGYDPYTGNPCETDGYVRPGWDMDNVDFGWNQTDGFWGYWELHLEYIRNLAQADAQGKSIFICENAGNNFETWFCGCDDATANCYCTEFPMNAW